MANIGLDIGSYTVKICQLREKGGRFSLVNFGVADISEEPVESLDPTQKAVLIKDAVKRVMAESGIKAKDVNVSLSGEQVVVRYIKLPFMSKDELKGVIKYDAEQYIPFNISDVVLDFSITGEDTEEGQKKIEVLLVAVKEEIINQYIALFQSMGLNVNLIDVDCFAIQNTCEANYEKKDETIALLNIGAKYSNLNILENGITRFSRDIPIAGITLTKDIQKEFNIGFGEAEKLKREQGQIIIESEEMKLTRIPSKDDKRIKIYGAVVTSLGKLVMEARRAFDFYESSSKKKSISKVVLSGGTARFKNLDKFIGERLKVPVEMLNPFANIEVTDMAALDSKIKELGLFLPVSVGLSIRRPK